MTLPLVLFGIAALGGIVMAIMRFSGKPVPPMPLALLHGALAAIALVLLIMAVANAAGGSHTSLVALVLFLVAALGGFVLFTQHLRKGPLSIPLMVIHAVVAVAGFLTLLVAALG
ncbi:MAG TPA: hypothetical protein VGM29_08440 [Polyangiaceae bacterium]|jgi:hypothetical protein